MKKWYYKMTFKVFLIYLTIFIGVSVLAWALFYFSRMVAKALGVI